MVQGLNQNKRAAIAQEFQGGTVHLLSTAVGDGEGDTALTNNTEASVSTTNSNWTITHDNTAGMTILENTVAFGFGSQSGYTVAQILLESPTNTGHFLIDDTPAGDVNFSGGGNTQIGAGQLRYTLGDE